MFHIASDKNLFEDVDDSKLIKWCDEFKYSQKIVRKYQAYWYCKWVLQRERESDWQMNSFGIFSDSGIICQQSVKKESVPTQTKGYFRLWLFVSKYKISEKWCSIYYYIM